MIAAVLVLAAAFGGCDGNVPGEVPARHRPPVVMGRDFWHGFNRYSSSDRQPTLNPELEAHPALADAAFSYSARNPPPPADSGLTLWPTLAENFPSDSPDRVILSSNPHPDRPFFLLRRSERNRMTWGSPVTLDRADYAAWKATHPNLMVDGEVGEWCNDLDGAWRTLKGQKGLYGNDTPDSVRRLEALRAFMGEKPKTRYEHVALMKRYFDMRRERNYGGRMAVEDAHLNSFHLGADFGASFLVLETTASGPYRYQPSAMFIRGAARQFGVPWEWYVAGYMNGPAKETGEFLGDAMCRYPQTPTASGRPYYAKPVTNKVGRVSRIGNGGPDFGISRSLFRRTHYLAYLSGATFTKLEEWYSVVKMWDKAAGKVVFSPRGRIYADFVDFTRAHPHRGAHYSPVAICVPVAQGYPAWGGAPWAHDEFGYTAGDKALDAIFYTLVPGIAYGDALRTGREQCLANSPFANMYDVISPDVTSQSPERLLEVMKSYRALVVAGDYPDRTWEQALARYEAEGGRVVRVGADALSETVKVGKGRGIAAGETRYPRVERAFRDLQDAYFPFTVSGDCMCGLTVAGKHVWLYVFNNAGVTKYADAPEELDASKTAKISVTAREKMNGVRELLSGKTVATDGDSFAWTLGPGDLAIFEVR